MKRFFALLMMLILALSLTACSGNTEKPANTSEPASSGSEGSEPAWPEKPVTIIVPGAAGGGGDICARAIAPHLEKTLGTSVVVENVAGSNGAIAYNQVAHQTEADGYTIIFMPFPGIATQEIATEGCTYGLDNFIAGCSLAIDPNVICVANDNGKFSTLEEFVDYCKAHPGEVTVAVGNPAGDDSIAMTAFCDAAGIECTYVIYSGGSADRMAPLMGGHIDAAVWNGSETTGLGDSVTTLGIMSEERYFSLPDLPTFAEQGYDISYGAYRGLGFPAGTDEAIVKKLSNAVAEALATPECIEQCETAGINIHFEDYITYDQTQHEKQDVFRAQWEASQQS